MTRPTRRSSAPNASRGSMALMEQLAAQHGNRPPSQEHPVLTELNHDRPAAGRRLISHQAALPQFGTPVWSQGAVRGAGDRVFRHPCSWSKKPGHEIILGLL